MAGRVWSRLCTILDLLYGSYPSEYTRTLSPTLYSELHLDSDSTTSAIQPPLSSYNRVSISIESGLSWDMRTLELPDGTRTLRLTISAPR
jgi:hypothetical protein